MSISDPRFLDRDLNNCKKYEVGMPCQYLNWNIALYQPDNVSCLVGNITLHRVEFQTVLARHLGKDAVTTHFHKRFSHYILEDKGGVSLYFRDGSTAKCDVLIGADGIHSATRRTMIALASEEAQRNDNDEMVEMFAMPGVKDPIWSGSVAYRTLVDSEKLKKLNPSHSALVRVQNVSLL